MTWEEMYQRFFKSLLAQAAEELKTNGIEENRTKFVHIEHNDEVFAITMHRHPKSELEMKDGKA